MADMTDSQKRMQNHTAWLAAGAPRCCYSCEFLTDEKKCTVFNMQPPEDYLTKPDDCSQWCEMVPF